MHFYSLAAGLFCANSLHPVLPSFSPVSLFFPGGGSAVQPLLVRLIRRSRWIQGDAGAVVPLNPVVTSREHRDDPGVNRSDYIRLFTSGIPRSTVISGKCGVYSVVGVRLICASTQVGANRHFDYLFGEELFVQMVFLCIHGSASLNLLCALPVFFTQWRCEYGPKPNQ